MASFTWAEYETNVPEGHSPRVRCYYCYRGPALGNSSVQQKEEQMGQIEQNESITSEPIEMDQQNNSNIKIENESKAESLWLMDGMEMEDTQSPSSNLEGRPNHVRSSSPSIAKNNELKTEKNKKIKVMKRSVLQEYGRVIQGLVNRNFESHIKSSNHRNRFPKELEALNQKKADKNAQGETNSEQKEGDNFEENVKTQTLVTNQRQREANESTVNLIRTYIIGAKLKLSRRQIVGMTTGSSLAGAKLGHNLRSEASVVEIQRFASMISRYELFDHIKHDALAIGTFYDAASDRTQKLLLNGVIVVVGGYAMALPNAPLIQNSSLCRTSSDPTSRQSPNLFFLLQIVLLLNINY